MTHFRKALEISPDYAEAHYNLGNAFAGLGRIDEAVAHYRKALELNPRWPDVHNNLGFLLASRGRLGEAIDHYRQALQIQPGHVAASRNLDAALQAQKSTRPFPGFSRRWTFGPTT